MRPSPLHGIRDSANDMQKSDSVARHCKVAPHDFRVEAALEAFPSFFARTSLWYFCTATGDGRPELKNMPEHAWTGTASPLSPCTSDSPMHGGGCHVLGPR